MPSIYITHAASSAVLISTNKYLLSLLICVLITGFPGSTHAPALYNIEPKNYATSTYVWWAAMPPTYIFLDGKSNYYGIIGV